MSTGIEFGINGRFLTQPVTGVQRYARSVIGAMDKVLGEAGTRVPILAPRGAKDPGLAAMPLVHAGPFGGQAWEQSTLPQACTGRLLNLCNTAPAAKTDQIVCVHDANIFLTPEAYGRSFRTFYRILQPILARRAARITTVSAFSARQIAQHLSLNVTDIAVLPNGHEHVLSWDPALAEVAARAFAETGGAPARPFILTIGSRSQHKNLDLLLEIAPRLDELGVDIVVAGGSSSIFSSGALETSRNVKSIGYVTDHDLAYLMERALCLAFPSWMEGFGLPIVEAMALGCPVISSDRASMPEVCGDAALMAAPDEPEAWTKAIQSLLASPDLRTDLIGRGRERSRLFSWAETAGSYVELLQQPATRLDARRVDAPKAPSVAVVVATVGRPAVVADTVRHLLANQTLKPVQVIVSCVKAEDAGDLADHPDVTILLGRPGLAAQRNTALQALSDETDIVVFFDDDFVCDADWLSSAAQTFADQPDVVGFTGHVLADDIKGPGLSFADAVKLIEAPRAQGRHDVESYSPYGCNMAFRRSAIGDLRFDERLVLYGWLEDRDFGARLAQRGGRLIKSGGACGVHMGVKSGRVAGDRLGYSQIVNPIYLLRKGSMNPLQVADHVMRNVASNLSRSVSPEPFIDRRGRLKGNIRGLADILKGRIEPERATGARRS